MDFYSIIILEEVAEMPWKNFIHNANFEKSNDLIVHKSWNCKVSRNKLFLYKKRGIQNKLYRKIRKRHKYDRWCEGVNVRQICAVAAITNNNLKESTFYLRFKSSTNVCFVKFVFSFFSLLFWLFFDCRSHHIDLSSKIWSAFKYS